MDSIYRENILDHYQNPSHRGTMAKPTVEARDANPLCGDDLTLQIAIDDEGTIEDCVFSGHGCSISQAAADILCSESIGKKVEEVLSMEKKEMLELLGIPLGPVRVKCGLLAFKIMKLALVKATTEREEGESDEAQGM